MGAFLSGSSLVKRRSSFMAPFTSFCGGQTLGPLEDGLRRQRAVGVLLQHLLVGGAGGGQRLGLVGRLGQDAGQPLLAVAELEQRVGRLWAVRL